MDIPAPEPSHDQRVEALSRLEGSTGYQANQRLKVIDRMLFLPEDFANSDLQRILEKRNYPLQIERAIELYLMMARLTKLCEPKGETIGPACTVRLINFEKLTLAEALDLKNGIILRLGLNRESSFNAQQPFCGLDLLTAEERKLYEVIKPYFKGRAKPTLKILAARLLRNEDDKAYSERTVLRYIQELKVYKFIDQNQRRDYLIRSVNSFGTHNKSTREFMRESKSAALAAAAQQMTQLIPQIPIITHQTFQSLAQISSLISDVGPCLAEAYRSMPQASEVRAVVKASIDAWRSMPHMLAQVHTVIVAWRFTPQFLHLLADLNQRSKASQN